jgi:hypothetical protein
LTAWHEFLTQVQNYLKVLEESGCDCPFFRGHADDTWKLNCGLGRKKPDEYKKKQLESILYYDFLSQAGPLLQRPDSSWDVLFTMQHHALPTRLLDWSATFAVGLYFALKPYIELASSAPEALEDLDLSPCVWVLDPFELNRSMNENASILNPEIDLDGSYQEVFIEESKSIDDKVIAVNPSQTGRRLAAQRGCFTLHVDLSMALETLAPPILKKFVIPPEAIADGIGFLRLAGMHEYSLFPDLDGLARHLKALHVD